MKRLLKSVIVLILSSCFLSSGASAYISGSVSGSSQMEREIRWLWKHLYEFVNSCSQSKTACRDPKILKLVDELKSYLPPKEATTSIQWEKQLQFLSEKEHPELFQSNTGETHRNAVTELKKNATVFINTDRMNLSLENWVGILVHETLHHLGVADDSDRLPDQVGAAIAQHFKRQTYFSTLEQFQSPETKGVVFNSEAEGRSVSAFLSSKDWTLETAWQLAPNQPACRPDEKLKKQFASSPVWRMIRLNAKRGLVTVKGGGFVKTDCVQIGSGSIRSETSPLDGFINLQYPMPFSITEWENQKPQAVLDAASFGISGNENDHMLGLAQTFLTLKTTYQKEELRPGDVWRAEVILQSIDLSRPTSCQVFVVGTQYEFLEQVNMPGVNTFDSCKLTPLDQGQWKVEAELRLPPEIRPDSYYIPLITLKVGENDRIAMPNFPSFVQVRNELAPRPPVIQLLRIVGLKQATSFDGNPTANSYVSKENQEFHLEFDVIGEALPTEIWLDANIWIPGETHFGIMNVESPHSTWPAVFKSVQTVTIPGGTKVIIKGQMEKDILGNAIAAIQLKRVYSRTSDFSWVAIELPNTYEWMLINEKWGK